MQDLELPIFKKTYDLYKTFCEFRSLVSKQYKHTICEKVENYILEILELILQTNNVNRIEKLALLETMSLKLNMLRIFIRLMKDTRAIDMKKYVVLQADIDEIGRMLGGWIKSTREK
ncbi:MAG: diversity-generating retroelement protein Avd [Candidatus Paceibacterota bacterium]